MMYELQCVNTVLFLVVDVLPPLFHTHTHTRTHTHTHTHSITLEPMTTSEGSVIEARIRVLKERLRQRKEEVKKVQSEQKRKKKAILRQQEEQLQKKLEVRMVRKDEGL